MPPNAFLGQHQHPGNRDGRAHLARRYDRWLILPQGRLNIIDFDFYRRVAEKGNAERSIWQFSWGGRSRFNSVWDMVLEGSTGFSGAFARQVTLNRESAGSSLTVDLLDALERSARDGGIVLQGEGAFKGDGKSTPVALQFDAQFKGGTYVKRYGDRESFSRAAAGSLASEGRFLGTFTARMGNKVDVDSPQPALWTLGPIEKQRGRQEFPVLHGKNTAMTISGRHIQPGAHVIVDGNRVAGTVTWEGETVKVELAAVPAVGMHFLQVQNPDGLFSNDFIFHVSERAEERERPKDAEPLKDHPKTAREKPATKSSASRPTSALIRVAQALVGHRQEEPVQRVSPFAVGFDPVLKLSQRRGSRSRRRFRWPPRCIRRPDLPLLIQGWIVRVSLPHPRQRRCKGSSSFATVSAKSASISPRDSRKRSHAGMDWNTADDA